MNIDILYRPTAVENLLAGRIWPAGRRLPMHDLKVNGVSDRSTNRPKVLCKHKKRKCGSNACGKKTLCVEMG